MLARFNPFRFTPYRCERSYQNLLLEFHIRLNVTYLWHYMHAFYDLLYWISLIKNTKSNRLGFIMFYNHGVNKERPFLTGRNNCRSFNPYTDDRFPAMLDTLFDQYESSFFKSVPCKHTYIHILSSYNLSTNWYLSSILLSSIVYIIINGKIYVNETRSFN